MSTSLPSPIRLVPGRLTLRVDQPANPILELLETNETSCSGWRETTRHSPGCWPLEPRRCVWRLLELRPWFGAPGSGKSSRAKRHRTHTPSIDFDRLQFLTDVPREPVFSNAGVRSNVEPDSRQRPNRAVLLPDLNDTCGCTSKTEAGVGRRDWGFGLLLTSPGCTGQT